MCLFRYIFGILVKVFLPWYVQYSSKNSKIITINSILLIFFIFTFFFSLVRDIQLSNFLFLLVPPISIYLFQDYGRCISRGIHVVWALLFVIGLSSAYFHATLSLVGQLLDEVSILWGFAAVYALFFPNKLFPKWMSR